MGTALAEGVTALVSSGSSVFDFITGSTVLPYFIIGIAASALLFGVHIVKSVVWGS